MSNSHEVRPDDFTNRVVDNFYHAKYELTAESYETTWGFRSTSGKFFKVSNKDLVKAFSDVLANWDEWCRRDLNVNSDNPDETLAQFSKRYFSDGAHKDLAEVQRRGFLHLLNSVAYASRHNQLYDEAEWHNPLVKSDYEKALAILRNYSEDAEKITSGNAAADTSPSSADRVEGGENALFYGAPGTGKSYDVWQKIDKATDPHFVTVFHPDMQNSDFAGTLKPGVTDDKVTYAFRPGPFARAVACAWANPGKKVYLVIEELNRAVAAAVFGELFQLLDRYPDGSSCYEVDFPSPEFEEWFVEAAGSDAERLALPSNLWILATMNSADQGVYPLDTAFRRRWRQHYLAIDYKKAPVVEVGYVTAAGKHTTDWRNFVQALNGFLVSDLQVDEDRLIGPRFVDELDLQNGRLPGKLLIYLWDDLLRHHQDKALFHSSVRTYGDLDRRILQDKQIFSDGFLDLLGADYGGNSEEVE